jgi:very-short-patch-repair endonuclease
MRKEFGCHRATSRSEQALSSKAVPSRHDARRADSLQIIAGFIVDFYVAHLVIEVDGWRSALRRIRLIDTVPPSQ